MEPSPEKNNGSSDKYPEICPLSRICIKKWLCYPYDNCEVLQLQKAGQRREANKLVSDSIDNYIDSLRK